MNLPISMSDVIEEIVGQGRREGGCLKFRSPFRANERTPSFAVYPSTNTWFDWGMGVGGDVIEFFRKWLGCSYKEALCEAEHYALAGRGAASCPAPAQHPARERERKLSLPILRDGNAELEQMGLPSVKGCFTALYKESVYLCFPCPDRHHPEGLECRRISGDGARRLTLGKKSIWIQKGADGGNRFTVCESITDCLASIRFTGNENLLALNSVSNWRKAVEWLNANAGSVSLALDDDEPGIQTTSLMMRELTIPCRDRSFWYGEAGVKDFYRLLQKNEEETWKN